MSLRYRDADTAGVQVVYGISHTLPNTILTGKLFRTSVATAMLRTVCEQVCSPIHTSAWKAFYPKFARICLDGG